MARPSLLDMVDQQYNALQEGRRAGLAGLLRGECPEASPAGRQQWQRGWAQGAAIRMRVPMQGLVLGAGA